MSRSVDRSEFRYFVTVHTKRREVLYMLRALSMAAQRRICNQIPWSGVDDKSWRTRKGLATFRFSEKKFQQEFIEWARELLPVEAWAYIGKSEETATAV